MKKLYLALLFIALLFVSGCQKTPEEIAQETAVAAEKQARQQAMVMRLEKMPDCALFQSVGHKMQLIGHKMQLKRVLPGNTAVFFQEFRGNIIVRGTEEEAAELIELLNTRLRIVEEPTAEQRAEFTPSASGCPSKK